MSAVPIELHSITREPMPSDPQMGRPAPKEAYKVVFRVGPAHHSFDVPIWLGLDTDLDSLVREAGAALHLLSLRLARATQAWASDGAASPTEAGPEPSEP